MTGSRNADEVLNKPCGKVGFDINHVFDNWICRTFSDKEYADILQNN